MEVNLRDDQFDMEFSQLVVRLEQFLYDLENNITDFPNTYGTQRNSELLRRIRIALNILENGE